MMPIQAPTQAYLDGFQGEAGAVRVIRLPVLAEEPVLLTPSPASRRGRRGRVRRAPVVVAAPVRADCSVPSSLNSAAAERCRILDRQTLTELTFRHASAMAAYFSAMAVVATRFDPTPGAAQMIESRAEAVALGDDLIRVAGIDAGGLEPFAAGRCACRSAAGLRIGDGDAWLGNPPAVGDP